MSGGPDNKHTERFTRAAFLCAALVLALLLLQPLTAAIVASARPASTPAPSPSAAPETCTVAFFGATSDPFCAPLYAALEELCGARDWRLVSYDCRGYAVNQTGQIEDFLRTGTADVAVLYSVLEQDDLNDRVKELHKACPVVTVGQAVERVAKRYVSAHVGTDETERVRVLADYFKDNLKRDKGILLLCDVPDAAAERLYEQTLSKEKVTVQGKNYSWGDAVYARRYLDSVDSFSDVGGILCTSRHGTAGAAATLGEKKLRDRIKIAALSYEPAMADDLALGELDAAVAVAPKEAGELLAEVLPKIVKGETVEEKTLTPILVTPENMDEVDLGYE